MQFKINGRMTMEFNAIVEADTADEAYCKCADKEFVSIVKEEPFVLQDTMVIRDVNPDSDKRIGE